MSLVAKQNIQKNIHFCPELRKVDSVRKTVNISNKAIMCFNMPTKLFQSGLKLKLCQNLQPGGGVLFGIDIGLGETRYDSVG